jgi:drug/metabolite transporter (DMT)-like permease
VSAALQMICGGAIVGTIGLVAGEASALHFSARSLAAFLYLVVFGSVIAYGAYIYALAKLPTSVVSLYAYINPVVAVYLGWLILDETITPNAIVGMLVIFAGVAMVQKRKLKPEGTAPSAPLANAGEA